MSIQHYERSLLPGKPKPTAQEVRWAREEAAGHAVADLVCKHDDRELCRLLAESDTLSDVLHAWIDGDRDIRDIGRLMDSIIEARAEELRADWETHCEEPS